MSFIKYIIAAVGVALLGGAYLAFSSTQDILKTAVSTQGTVIELVRSRSSSSSSSSSLSDSDYTYAPVVEFETQDGRRVEFKSSTSSNPPSYSRGEKVEVLYQETFPENAKIQGFFSLWGLSMIVGIFGLILSLIGFGIIFSSIKKSKKIKALKDSGTRVNAEVQSVGLNTSLKVNGRHPFQIIAQWQNPTTTKIHIFKSDNIWFDPEEYVKGNMVDVLIEPDNPKVYHVDTSFLPEVA